MKEKAIPTTASSEKAIPKEVNATFVASKIGMTIARTNETFRSDGTQYSVQSVTNGAGAYALFGSRKMSSVGTVSAQGLKPSHFQLKNIKGDTTKTFSADFNWANKVITVRKPDSAAGFVLSAGAQDLASFGYQFMFNRPKSNAFVLPLTTGKTYKNFNYRVISQNEIVETDAGKYTCMHLVNGDKELWLGKEAYYLPVKFTIIDKVVGKITVELAALHVK
jgi:hypothetical protein